MQKAGSNNLNGNNSSKNQINQFLNERFGNFSDEEKQKLTSKREFRDNDFRQYVKNRNVDINQRREKYIAEKMSKINSGKMDSMIKTKTDLLLSRHYDRITKRPLKSLSNSVINVAKERAKEIVKAEYIKKFGDEFDKGKLKENMNEYKTQLKNKYWPKSEYSVNKSQTYTQWLKKQEIIHQSKKRVTNDNNYNNQYVGNSRFNSLSIYNIPETISLYSKEENIQQKPSFFGSMFGKTPTPTGGNGKKRSVKKPSIKKASSKKAPVKKSSSKKAPVKKSSSKKAPVKKPSSKK